MGPLHSMLHSRQLPLPATYNEMKLLKNTVVGLQMNWLIREVITARYVRIQAKSRKNYSFLIHLRAYQSKQKLLEKCIERLKKRRFELQYCSKRARPISLSRHSYLNRPPQEHISASRALNQQLIKIRQHKISHLHKYRHFIKNFVKKPFSTFTNSVSALASWKSASLARMSPVSSKTAWSTKQLLGWRMHHLAMSYLPTTNFFFYGQMIFIRARLGYYRFRQSTMLNFAANIAKRHWFAYAVIFGHMAYFGSYRSGLVMKKQVETVEPRSRSLWKTFDQGFREFLKYQMYDNLFSNTWIDNRTAQALWDLT